MQTSQHKEQFSHDPVDILQNLVRFDTTNPPGNEGPCIQYIQDLLEDADIPTTIVFTDPERPNLVARLKGHGSAAPLLLYGHVDVVTTENQKWTYPPFDGHIAGGFIWGRGTLDMKGGVAMMISALLRAKAEGIPLPGDMIFAVMSDEETLGACGTAYLVQDHAELFDGVKYAISEFGGFTLKVAGKTLYPIAISEKQSCWLTATIKGEGGHGSMPVEGGAMANAAKFLTLLDERQLPVHVTSSARFMCHSMAASLGGLNGFIFRQLTNPLLTNSVLNLLGEQKKQFSPLLHNTVSATGLRGSHKINVIPSEVVIELDGRVLPGFGPEDLVDELEALVGGTVDSISFEVRKYQPGPAEPDMGMFHTLTSIIKEMDPEGIPLPMMLPGVTDARLLSKLGIQTYGFLPMQLPDDFKFTNTVHGADERIPVAAMAFGSNAIYELLKRFGDESQHGIMGTPGTF